MNIPKIRHLARDAAMLAVIVLIAAFAGQLFGSGWKQWNQQPLVEEFVPGAIPEIAADQWVMIASSTCPACANARRWLAQQGIVYRELTVDQSPRARAIADQLDVQTVPTFLIGDTRINGFVPSELQQRLGAAKNRESDAVGQGSILQP